MKRDDQHKKVLSLRKHIGKMSREDKEIFAMLMKRDRDDEDLDAQSLALLGQMLGRYATKKGKDELDANWKELTGG